MAKIDETDGLLKCKDCGAIISASERYCHCTADNGAPNVKAAQLRAESDSLIIRYTSAGGACEEDEQMRLLLRFRETAKASQVVISRNVEALYQTVFSHHFLMAGYHGKHLKPEQIRHETDIQKRSALCDELFWPGYSTALSFGVLTLNGRGVKAHGIYDLVIPDGFIKRRVSFLEENAQRLAEKHEFPAKPPLGTRAWWENRDILCAVKVQPKIAAGLLEEDFKNALIDEDNVTGVSDYIEAQIYDFASRQQIARFNAPPPSGADAHYRELIDAELSGWLRK